MNYFSNEFSEISFNPVSSVIESKSLDKIALNEPEEIFIKIPDEETKLQIIPPVKLNSTK